MTPGSEILPADAVRLLDDLTGIVARACAEIRAISPVTVVQRIKPDRSPVTVADELSEATILQGLARLLPGVPVISEESAHDRPVAGLDKSFLIVDPLDGTREFIAGRDEFTVNLAIVTRGVPIAGIIAAPGRGQVWRGVVGEKAERLRLLAGRRRRCADNSHAPLAGPRSRRHRQPFALRQRAPTPFSLRSDRSRVTPPVRP